MLGARLPVDVASLLATDAVIRDLTNQQVFFNPEVNAHAPFLLLLF